MTLNISVLLAELFEFVIENCSEHVECGCAV